MHVDYRFWCYAAEYIGDASNATPRKNYQRVVLTSANPTADKSPLDFLADEFPEAPRMGPNNLERFHRFGCLCYVHKEPYNTLTKTWSFVKKNAYQGVDLTMMTLFRVPRT